MSRPPPGVAVIHFSSAWKYTDTADVGGCTYVHVCCTLLCHVVAQHCLSVAATATEYSDWRRTEAEPLGLALMGMLNVVERQERHDHRSFRAARWPPFLGHDNMTS